MRNASPPEGTEAAKALSPIASSKVIAARRRTTCDREAIIASFNESGCI
jgi:hypothetical protein